MKKPVTSSILVVVLTWVMGTGATAQESTRFRTSVEVTSLDVSVVDGNGWPITNLGVDAFAVRIDGKPRRVLSAEWISLVSRPTKGPAAAVAPDGFSTNENATDGRIIVIAVDQPHIRTTSARSILRAAGGFVDRLSSSDRVAVVGFGMGGPATALTSDRERIKKTLAQMTGEKQADVVTGEYNIALSEAIAIHEGHVGTTGAVVDRECPIGVLPTASATDQQAAATAKLRCRAQIEEEAGKLATESAIATDATLRALRDLLARLGAIDAPKTLVLISEGFVLGGTESWINELGTMAAATRTSLYALQLEDEEFFSVEIKRRPMAPAADARERRASLELLAAAARGTLFTTFGLGDRFFGQLEAEISGYYLLGVESDAGDRDGRVHPVRIEVPQRGAIVRSRRQMIMPADTIRSPREAVTAGLQSPLLLSGLPLRVATFSLQGPERGKVQLLIHADVGKDYRDGKDVSAGYTIADQTGRIVDGWVLDSQLAPMTSGQPSALQLTVGASLAPGDYTLRLVVAEGHTVGSVEHPIHASLSRAGAYTLSELMVGGPLPAQETIRPTVAYTAGAGGVHGYLEAYGPQVAAVTARYEIATDVKAPALVSTDVPGRVFGDRTIFSFVMPVDRLPPGTYVLRAVVSAAATPLTALTRSFEIADSPSAGGAWLLPVDWQPFARSFRRDEALAPEALKPFRDRLAASVQTEFEAGLTFLEAGDYPRAEASLKRAIRPDVDSTAAMTYLAATFAASGHDQEASAVWQTALVDGGDVPQIYDWLAGSLVRSRRLEEARAILEEAMGKWPSDARFTGPLAAVYAAQGEGPQALSTLDRYLAARPDDREALERGVAWIYRAHASRRILRGEAEDLRLARAYADAYTKANGPESALVRRWVEFLEHERR